MNKVKALAGLGIVGGGGTATAIGINSLSRESKNEEAILDQGEQEKPVQTKSVEINIKPEEVTAEESNLSGGSAANGIFDLGINNGGCAIRVRFQAEKETEKIIELSDNTDSSKEADLKSLYAILKKEDEVKSLCETSNSNGKVLEAIKLETNKWIFKEGDAIEESDQLSETEFP